jgi:hypothetical protein
LRKKENQKMMKQSALYKDRLQAEVDAIEKENDPEKRKEVIGKHAN